MSSSDIIVIGGGIAGLSAASVLSAHAKVTLLEAEEAVGYHSSGRSATMLHYALGDPLVRALTLASRVFFEAPPTGFSDAPLGHRMPVLIHARESELAELDRLHADIASFAHLERVGEEGVLDLCPAIRTGEGCSVAGLLYGTDASLPRFVVYTTSSASSASPSVHLRPDRSFSVYSLAPVHEPLCASHGVNLSLSGL